MEGVEIVTTRSAVSGMDGCCLCAWPPGTPKKGAAGGRQCQDVLMPLFSAGLCIVKFV